MATKIHKKQVKFLRRTYFQEFFLQVVKISPLVKEILEKNLEARDDDNLLFILVWKAQGAEERTSFKKFKYNLIRERYATPETISRSRRLIQSKNSNLRGKFYKERHKSEEKFINQYKIFFP